MLALLLAACGNGAATTAENSATPTPESGVIGSPQVSVAPSSTAAGRVYPYALAWPEEELETDWRYASAPWDGRARIDHGNKYTDSVTTTVGDVFAFGYETSATVVDLQALVASMAAEWHGCDERPVEEARLAAGGEDGILAVHDCGTRQVVRWFAVHDGFGLTVALIVAPEVDSNVARSQFEYQISQLAWDG